jgi:hypothetical protein
MHYQSDGFAKPGTYTLLSKFSPQIIQRNLLITDTDAKEIQLLYKCTAGSQTTTASTTTASTTTASLSKLIQWNEVLGNSWAYSCGFVNNDLKNVAIGSDLCSSKCRTTLGCTHYSWSNGVCNLKKNTVTKANAFNNNNPRAICGILTPGNFNLD